MVGPKFEKPGQFSPPFFGGSNFWIFECGAKIVPLTRLLRSKSHCLAANVVVLYKQY